MKKNHKKGFLVKSLQSLFFCSFLLIFSCEQGEEKVAPGPRSANVEQAFVGQTGVIKSGKLYGTTDIQYMEIENQKVFEGDIILTEEQLSEVTAANGRTEGAARNTLRWPNGVVYYSIASDLPDKFRVTDAIAHWQAYSSLKFVQRTTQANYILFRYGSGCSSSVGMVGGVQHVTLGNCSTGSTIHEIGHAIGIWHEQSRSDRDNYIKILWQNIETDAQHNFNKYTQYNEGFNHGGFDFGSIMMYSPFAFSSNGQPTIQKLDGSSYTVQRDGLSGGDKAIAAKMYPINVEAESYAFMAGVFTEPCSEGGLNVGSFDAGDWTAYNVNIPVQGKYRVTYRVASPYTGKTLRLERNSGTVILGTVGIPNTGGWQNWTSVYHDVDLPAGANAIGIATSTGGLNINKFTIAKL